jgi:methylphosphotriester-DNA--protein-cysteine methyltransferase
MFLTVPGPAQEFQLSAAPGTWRLTRADPASDLAGRVIEYWEVEGALSAFRETLLPNGAVELMINLGRPHRVIGPSGSEWWTRAWFSGLHEQALTIESLEGTHLLSARLHPIGAVSLLGSRVATAANRIIELEEFLGQSAELLRERVVRASSVADRFDLLERHLREHRASDTDVPDFVVLAAEQIEQGHGNVRVAMLHESLGVSRKHLAVTFMRHVGVSLKAYAKIRRFMWTLAQLQASQSVSWSVLASDAGYSDQSHLARDFRRIGAASPTEYLRRRAPGSPGAEALLYDAE